MSFSITLTNKESFDNYIDYKDEIEYKLCSTMNSDDSESFDLAVVKELYTMNIINYEFYVKQCENIKTIHLVNLAQILPIKPSILTKWFYIETVFFFFLPILKILLLISFIIGVILILYKYKSMDRFEL